MLPYKLHTVGNVIVVEITGLGLMEGSDLDLMAARLPEELMRSKGKRMVLDCQRLKFMASAALSVIGTLSHLANQHKGGFVVCGLQARLSSIFRISGLDRHIPICGTREEAVARLADQAGGTPSDTSAQKEFGLTQDEIIKVINRGDHKSSKQE